MFIVENGRSRALAVSLPRAEKERGWVAVRNVPDCQDARLVLAEHSTCKYALLCGGVRSGTWHGEAGPELDATLARLGPQWTAEPYGSMPCILCGPMSGEAAHAYRRLLID